MYQKFWIRFTKDRKDIKIFRMADNVLLGTASIESEEIEKTEACTQEEFDSFGMLLDVAYERASEGDDYFTFEVDI